MRVGVDITVVLAAIGDVPRNTYVLVRYLLKTSTKDEYTLVRSAVD